MTWRLCLFVTKPLHAKGNPMSENTKHVTYEDAGVDTAEGGRAVDAI